MDTTPQTPELPEAVLCSAPNCEARAELMPVLMLRHKRHKAAHEVVIQTPVCLEHPPTFDIIVAGEGWRTLADWLVGSGRPRPRRKFSELNFRRITDGPNGPLLDVAPHDQGH